MIPSKRKTSRPLPLLLAAAFLPLGIGLPAAAESIRTQTLQLQPGWNAVFLEVYPADPDPAIMFANTPIDVAAAFYASGS